jgi:hypothetical protein
MSMAAPLPERSESPSSHARSWPRPPLSRRRRLGERDCARRDGDSLSGATKPQPVWGAGFCWGRLRELGRYPERGASSKIRPTNGFCRRLGLEEMIRST